MLKVLPGKYNTLVANTKHPNSHFYFLILHPYICKRSAKASSEYHTVTLRI